MTCLAYFISNVLKSLTAGVSIEILATMAKHIDKIPLILIAQGSIVIGIKKTRIQHDLKSTFFISKTRRQQFKTC